MKTFNKNLEARLLSMGLNPMNCLDPDHDCKGDPHFIVDTKHGRKEVFPRSKHISATFESLDIITSDAPASDHDKNMEEIRRCCAEPNSLMAFCGMDGARMLCNALDAYEALEHERKADQDFANQERERADRLIEREVKLTEKIAKLKYLLKQWRTYYRQEVCSVGNEPPEKLMLETVEALNE